MMADDSDFDERREALKARVQAQIEASKEAKLERQQNASEELVVDESDLNDARDDRLQSARNVSLVLSRRWNYAC